MSKYLFGILGLVAIATLYQSCLSGTREYGKELYLTHCSNCHGLEGHGLQQLYPPLRESDYTVANQELIPCIIRNGLSDTIVVNGVSYAEVMPPMPLLTDIDIHNIINYISQEINPDVRHVDIKKVNEEIQACPLN